MCRLELSLAKSTWRQTSLSLGDLGCFGKKHGPPARHGMCAYAHSVPAVVGDQHCRGCNGDACLGTQIVTPAVPAKPYGVSPLTAYVHRVSSGQSWLLGIGVLWGRSPSRRLSMGRRLNLATGAFKLNLKSAPSSEGGHAMIALR